MRFATCSFALLALVAVGCSAGSKNDDGTGGSGNGNGSGGAGGTIFTGTGGGTGGSLGCSEQAKLIYVLSDDNDLYSFNPPAKQFTLIGPLGCNTPMAPNSMAVDRDATAWVNYVEGDAFGDTAGVIFRVDTSDASCEPVAAANLPAGWYRDGMGFATNGANTTDETLYLAGIGSLGGGSGLGKLLGSSFQGIGSFTGQLSGQNAELTGTGDGRLFGFFTTTPVQVAEIDRTSAAILSQKQLPTVEIPWAWAFSFWGGDFYLYTAPDQTTNPTRTTNVTHYSPGSDTVDTAYMTNIGFRIVGAGVSTCAPLVPPS